MLPLLYTVFFSFNACRPTKARICNITFDYAPDAGHDTTTARKWFYFTVTTAYDDLCIASVNNPFVSSCYAFKKCYSFENDLDTTSFSLVFDRRIIHGTDTLAAGANIFRNTAFKQFVPLSGDGKECSAVRYIIGKNDSTVLQQLTFDTAVYAAHFTCKTTDGKPMDKVHYMRFR